MNCEEIEKNIPAYINKNCADNEVKGIEEHLCICNNCRVFLTNFMDRNTSSTKPLKSSYAHKKTGFIEYLIVGAGIIVLGLLFYLLIKS